VPLEAPGPSQMNSPQERRITESCSSGGENFRVKLLKRA
jgi:hypothetical protein